MRREHRTSWIWLLVFGVVGAGVGALVQAQRSAVGVPPLVPPLSLSATLTVLAGVLLVLGILLRRAVTHRAERMVNPFHAVRLLAASRASQFVGALFGGFGLGALLPLGARSVPAPGATWAPILATAITGAVLLGVGLLVEHWCRVPPSDDEDGEGSGGGPGGGAAGRPGEEPAPHATRTRPRDI
ncbi:hypothetical protein BMH32_14655 [Leucobacter sp. OLJS4]|uniref:DUF3180 family protein n=1 Tax=unclassified Leucobacter TaxID=2621730 RepID=UPI000C18F96D|nr:MULTISPECIES: DUF3180 family protein [unclassified Leucobacter]PII83742.1 hypothetical protein BMH25_06425 [Leucobacter sp. OLCALW19]PII89275.1 hypothetical protein BMH26_03465 [Leucobacter sp. OLTLW20]PII90729.1 hypothetical protein BMH27_10295 [Leucobacter sp. OLAS13]PII96753.1 hypothetical protein BMH28_14675 [Leucobacter sp. OLCS4]PII99557.1 hypothetical protein BMH29_03180 [Leucobacter sp. OLDS2]